MKNMLFLLVFLITFSSCKKAEASADEMAVSACKLPQKDEISYDESLNVPPPPPAPKVDQVKFVKPVVTNSEESIAEKIEQKIIKTGDLKFETNDLEKTYSQIKTALKTNNALIQNDNEGKDYGLVFRRIIIRVPSKNFDFFLSDISKGVAYFDNKEISSQNVTEEFIDIDARLKAKKVLEARYLELLKKATKVTEMLEIEKQLSAIREEIEAKEGQLHYMQSQISMSTISIEFYKNVAVEEGVTISYSSKIWNAISSGFNSFSSFIIEIISIWPVLIIFSIIIYFIRKKLKKKNQLKNEQ